MLGTIPSHWIHAGNAMFATAYHRAVIFDCDAVVSADPEVLAAQQQRLMDHYQPDGGYARVSAEHAFYRGPFNQIRALTLTLQGRKVKWKLAQNRSREQREKLIAALRARARPTDSAAADALQWTLDHEASKATVKLWRRAVLAWMLIILVESLHGVVREIFIAPRIGDRHARQIGVLIGCLFIFSIAWLTTRWIGAGRRGERLGVGMLWVALTLTFEIALGRATGVSWDGISSDYNPLRGGFMLFGLAFMCLAPLLAARLRKVDVGKTQ